MKTRLSFAIIAVALVVLVGCATTGGRYGEAFVNDHFIVGVDELASNLDNDRLVILDVRGPEDYENGHIPGAVSLPISWLERVEITDDGAEVTNLVLGAEDITPVFQDAGIDRRSRVVIYDAGGHVVAARVFWMLDYYGHENIAVLDGGFAAWTTLGNSTSMEAPDIAVGNFIATPDPSKIADFEYVQANLGSEATALCNALSTSSFEEGAIPGSVNVPRRTTYTEGDTPVLRSAEEMVALFEQVGIKQDTEVVFYCGRGYAAAQDYFVARALGLTNVRLYDGSLTDWRARGGKLTPSGEPTT